MKSNVILSATLLLAMTEGGNAADVLVKAKPAEYVKLCAAYGPGFFMIPGTDTCLRVGGYARFEAYVDAVGGFTPLLTSTVPQGFNGAGAGGLGYPFRDGDDSSLFTRSRGVLDLDARTQTDYGILRSFIRWGVSWDTTNGVNAGPGLAPYFERAFMQFGGFTFGYTQSLFDTGYDYFFTTPFAGSNRWTTVMAYTASFDNGVSTTLSLEDAANRTTGVQMVGSTPQIWYNINSSVTGLGYSNFAAGQAVPDIIGNIRIDQSWGTALVSGALHQVGALAPLYAGFVPGLETSSTWGWALGGTVEIKLPALAAGDSLFVQANYAKGAVSYAGLSASTQVQARGVGAVNLSQVGPSIVGTGAFYTVADAVAVNALGDYDLTTSWAVAGQFRHYWTPGLRSAVYVGYASYDVPRNIVAGFDFNISQVGLNTIWSPVKNIDIGAELLYTKIDGQVPLGSYRAIGETGASIGTLAGGSTDLWSGGIRIQRNF
ncbi:porin [Xanthobacter sp. KR7-225]|uniref:porin n=1 Tax=Xanthobacter sp. KR7-225 TaxID=3156613 RepID=UPI0032B31B2B